MCGYNLKTHDALMQTHDALMLSDTSSAYGHTLIRIRTY